jgi:protein sidekick
MHIACLVVIVYVCVVKLAVPCWQVRLNHVLTSYIQQVSSQTQCLMKQVNQVVLKDLTRNCNYDIVVVPFNSQGSGPPSPPVAVYVGEAVPTGEPQAVEGESVSSTEVRLRWKPPQQSQQNGDLLGYKVNSML